MSRMRPSSAPRAGTSHAAGSRARPHSAGRGGVGRLSHHMDQRVQKDRGVELRQAELHNFLKVDGFSAGQSHADRRVEGLRRQREDAAERRDMFLDYQYQKSEQEKEQKKTRGDLEEKLAEELERRRALEAREAAERRRICEGSEEIRKLKDRLNAAAMNKGRAQQMVERQLQEVQDQQRAAAVEAYCLEHQFASANAEAEQQQAAAQSRISAERANQDLIAHREAERRLAAQETYAKDKAQVNELVARIAQQDEEEQAQIKQKKSEERFMMENHRQERQQQRYFQERREAEEAASIEAFAKKKQQFEDELAKAKAEQDAEKQKQLKVLLDKQTAEMRRAEEHERILRDLHQEERELEARRIDDARREKLRQDRLDQHRTLQAQMRDNAQRRRQQEEEDEKFKQQLLAKFADDDKIEQMSAQKARMKVQEHRREVDRQLQERRALYEAEREKERAEYERSLALEQQRRAIVEEEKKRLLAEFGEELEDHVPHGFLEAEYGRRGFRDEGPPALRQIPAAVGGRPPRPAWQ